ncbi:hypothetical protein [Pedobacter sp. ASV28]|uniref:hypothetical protein n=1 Tax=Pedobacter sp. ASV28 TaxID=2795123 RepID=UPI0018ECFF03|nr:hypothetical protein [Pedobacter sp. ASV28]
MLRYQPSGIKVTDEATWVGLGWSLDPEPSIQQEIRGKSDTYDNYNYSNTLGGSAAEYALFKAHLQGINYSSTPQTGYCMNSFVPGFEQFPCGPTSDAYVILANLLAGRGQPDIYHYNLPGVSGSYFINTENNKLTLLDKSDEVKFVHVPYSNTIQAVTPNGITYNFGNLEYSNAGGGLEVSGKTFKVTSVQFPDSGHNIAFSYEDEQYSSFYNNANIVFNAYESATPPYANGVNITTGVKKRLSQIVNSEVTISFITSPRQDFLQNSTNTISKLDRIEIRSTVTGKLLKAYQFDYGYFNPNSTYQSKRLKLQSVKEIGYDEITQTANLSKPAYVFDYDETVNLPAKNSYSQDFWGYYNGQPNSTLIPDLDFFDYRHQITDFDGTPAFDYHPLYKANRYTDNSFAKAYMLKKVKYPTGGYTEYYFEPHTFENQFIPTNQQLTAMYKSPSCSVGPYYPSANGCTQDLDISEDTEMAMLINFNHGSPQIAGNLNTTVTGNMYNQAYVQIEKKNALGVVDTLKTWNPAYNNTSVVQFQNSSGTNISENFHIYYEPGATYKLVVSCPPLPNSPSSYPSLPNLAPVGVKASARFYNKLSIPHISSQCGFRIKEIKNYSEDNALASYRTYSYSGGKLLNQFTPLKVTPCKYNVNYTWDGYAYNWTTVFAKRVELSTENFGHDSGNPVGYDMVEERYVDTQNTGGKRQYFYINEPNAGRTGFPNSPNRLNGLLSKERTYDKNSTIVEEKRNTYSYLPYPDTTFFGIVLDTQSYSQWENISGSNVVHYGVNMFFHKYSFVTYPLYCSWTKLASTQTDQFYNGNALTSEVDYQFNDKGQTKSVSTFGSDGSSVETRTKYSSDSPFGQMIEQTMADANMINIPIKTENLRNNTILSTTKNGFANDPTTANRTQSKYLYSLKGGTPDNMELRATVDLYDEKGNILQYHLQDGINVSVVWGYNKNYPVAKVEGVAYDNLNSVITGIQTESSLPTGSEATLLNLMSQLRQSHPDAMVTTYTYKPGIGVSTITDAKGDLKTYTYDDFCRLQYVKDKDNNILSENDYNYRQ